MASNTPDKVPSLLYGTAFKFDNAADLVSAALAAGFRGVDTAGNKNNYREALVGRAISDAISHGDVKREDLYIQTKFSPFKAGRDKAIYPYDVDAPIEDQVRESVDASCRNFETDHIDCLVMHSIYPDIKDTIRAWKAMEALVPAQVSMLGLSNTDLETLRAIYDIASTKPSVVQNRLTEATVSKPDPQMPSDLPYPVVPYDRDVRSFCAEKSIRYSPWGVLWGNQRLMDAVRSHSKLLEEVGVSAEVACLSCVQSSSGCVVNILSGSKQVSRMHEVVQGLAKIERFRGRSEAERQRWQQLLGSVGSIMNGGVS